MTEWLPRSLADLARLQKGRKVYTTPSTRDGFVPYLGASALEGGPTQYADPTNAVTASTTDVLMLWDGERSGLVGRGQDGAVGSTVVKLTPRGRTNAGFLFHALNRKFDWIQARRTGTGIPHVPKDLASYLLLPVPHLSEEQVVVAEILDAIDEAIRSTEKLVAKLERMKRGLLHDLLTRGIDENGDLRDPELRSEDFKDSVVGHIPKGWKISRLRECLVASPRNGIYKPEGAIGRGTLLIGQTAITESRSIDVSRARRAEVSAGELERFGLHEGDLLVSRVFATVAGVGQPALVPKLPEPAVFESNMLRLRTDEVALDPQFLFNVMRTDAVRRGIVAAAKSSNQTSINQRELNALPLAIPPRAEQEHLVAVLSTHESRLLSEEAEHGKLSLLRAGLMDDLLTGRVRVSKLLEGSDA